MQSRAIADLWNKPLKLKSVAQISTKTPRSYKLCSEECNTPNRWNNDLPPTKLSFDGCESSADETSPPPPNLSRKSVGYRRSLSYTESETSKNETHNFLPTDGTPVFVPKRHKLQDDDDSSPFKIYLEAGSKTVNSNTTSTEVVNDENADVVWELKKTNASTLLTPEVKRLCFQRSHSESALQPPICSIKNALEKIESNPNLIGDGSKSYVLPYKLDGKHADLKEISCETLAELLDGKMKTSVSNFKVIDCRYPYEYEGGHIRGAINLFTKKQIYDEFIQPKLVGVEGAYTEERNILIFHCEFSSQRGPDMCRFLRDTDRESNASLYPRLYYPELYVLFGGYKAFYHQFPNFCEPQRYLPMDDVHHTEDCKHYKLRTKLEYPSTLSHRSKKSKSQLKFSRASSFAKKCNF